MFSCIAFLYDVQTGKTAHTVEFLFAYFMASFEYFQSAGYVTKSNLTQEMKWEEERANRALVSVQFLP